MVKSSRANVLFFSKFCHPLQSQSGALVVREGDDEEEAEEPDNMLVVREDDPEPEPEPVVIGSDAPPKKNEPHPSTLFNPGDVITINVGKANPKQDSGLKLEQRENGKYYVRKVAAAGLFAKTPVIVGDKLLELNKKDTHDYKNLNEMKKVLRDEGRITIMVLRRDPDASDSSASSILEDSDEEAEEEEPEPESEEEEEEEPMSNALVVMDDDEPNYNARAYEDEEEEEEEEEEEDYEEEDEDEDESEGYDGEYCGTVWCPDCNL